MSYAKLVNPALVPQSQPLNDRQSGNNAGGYVFAIDQWKRLERFLILGSDAATFYQSARSLTRDNARVVVDCWNLEPARTASMIVEISNEGRAPKNSPAIFALALGVCNDAVQVRSAAFDAVNKVCRTSTHLFEFIEVSRTLGKGWGRGMKRVVARWYDGHPTNSLAMQAVKYRSRNGYDHARLIKCAHPLGDNDDLARIALTRWICGREHDVKSLPNVVKAFVAAQDATNSKDLVRLIREHKLPREALPTWALRDAEIWKALLPHMRMTALIRNLGVMTELGVLKPFSGELDTVLECLLNRDELHKSRIHPFALLQALAVYKSGKAVKGERSWNPVSKVTDALNDGFYASFKNVVPSGKKHLLALDVSGSMGMHKLMNSPLSAREASAAMALVTAAVEPKTHFVGFSSNLVDIDISSKMRLDEATRKISRIPMGCTDCAQPMIHALRKGLEVDTFVVYTDNETYSGRIHPTEALKRYRKETGIHAKLIVVGMTSTGFSIADPEDGGMLDLVGFDSSAPSVMAQFSRD
ncbi:TROVE domain-containing protein [Roseibium sp. RKSG952]|uniref:TROVE domain-containing protein n=1 Tax=Roseibium sp. RKSG952 TaxID=2529384 RepID=UPI0018AD11D3|nr:TROVE domain-containing protein [Roseibium sp. RKSG952]